MNQIKSNFALPYIDIDHALYYTIKYRMYSGLNYTMHIILLNSLRIQLSNENIR